MRKVFLNFLPTLSKLDFTNFIVYYFWIILSLPDLVLDPRFLAGTLLFLFYLWKFILKGNSSIESKKYLYAFSQIPVLAALMAQLESGLFSFSSNTLFQNFTVIYTLSIIATVIIIVAVAELKGKPFTDKELFEERISEKSYSKKTYLIGAILTTLLFWVLIGLQLIPNPIAGFAFVFAVDKIATATELKNWTQFKK
ncbi:MAG: hypothetical protein QT03_C0001G0454 [archaeon GW2011_AR10]|nr:MAG: hypothetical protein QT03_C0001G0454 [archaeon GW2011_AR10]